MANLSRTETRNLSLPIFRLPPETLAAIFTHGAQDYFDKYSGRPIFDPPNWVSVSHVCSHWHNVALNCPALWTYHFTISLRWTEELLVRSKQTSLKIRIRYLSGFKGYAWWLTLVKKLMKHFERIEELCLYLPYAFLPAEPLLRAPRLKDLEIEVIEFYSFNNHRPPDWLGITDWHTPLLRTLKLFVCPLPWHRLKLGRVTTLSLQRVPLPLQQNVVDFLSTLRCMHNLTVLTVNNALTSPHGLLSSEALSASPNVDLPHLVHIAIIEPLSTVVALLFSINIPPKAEVRLYIMHEPNDDISPILSFVTQRFSTSKEPSSSATPRSLFISSTLQSPRFTFSALERDCAPPENVTDRSCNVLLDITIGNKEGDGYRIINDVCRCTPSKNLHSLHLGGFPPSLEFWKPLLTHFHGLRYLKLSDGYMPDLAFLLSLTTDAGGEDLGRRGTRDPVSTADHIFVPELEELELFRVTFSSEDDLPSGLICQTSLLDALSTRQGLRDRLTMVECVTV